MKDGGSTLNKINRIMTLLIILFSVVIIVTTQYHANKNEVNKCPIGLDVGNVAPNFKLKSLTGVEYSLSKQSQKKVNLIFFCGCQRCHVAAKKIAVLQRKGQLRDIIAIVALPADDAKIFKIQAGLTNIVLPDPSDRTAEVYESTDCPRVWQIKMPDCRVEYRSATFLADHDLAVALKRLGNDL